MGTTVVDALEGERGRVPPIVNRLLIAVVADIDGRVACVSEPLLELLAMGATSASNPAELPVVPVECERVSDEVGDDLLASVNCEFVGLMPPSRRAAAPVATPFACSARGDMGECSARSESTTSKSPRGSIPPRLLPDPRPARIDLKTCQ